MVLKIYTGLTACVSLKQAEKHRHVLFILSHTCNLQMQMDYSLNYHQMCKVVVFAGGILSVINSGGLGEKRWPGSSSQSSPLGQLLGLFFET